MKETEDKFRGDQGVRQMKELKQSEGGLLRYRAHGKLVVEGRAEAVDAANRRGQFWLLIAAPYLAAL